MSQSSAHCLSHSTAVTTVYNVFYLLQRFIASRPRSMHSLGVNLAGRCLPVPQSSSEQPAQGSSAHPQRAFPRCRPSFLSTLTLILSSPFSGQKTISADLSFPRSGDPGRREVSLNEDLAGAGQGSGLRAGVWGARWFRAGMRARAPASPPSPAPVLRAFFVNEAPL